MSAQPRPRVSQLVGEQVPQSVAVWLRAQKPCLRKLWPSCSKRPSFRRNMFWAMTGWLWLLEYQSSVAVPMLQDTVAKE